MAFSILLFPVIQLFGLIRGIAGVNSEEKTPVKNEKPETMDRRSGQEQEKPLKIQNSQRKTNRRAEAGRSLGNSKKSRRFITRKSETDANKKCKRSGQDQRVTKKTKKLKIRHISEPVVVETLLKKRRRGEVSVDESFTNFVREKKRKIQVPEEILRDLIQEAAKKFKIHNAQETRREVEQEDARKDSKSVESNSKLVILKKRKRTEGESEFESMKDGGAKDKSINFAVVGEKRKKMQNPQEFLIERKGFDSEYELLRTVVGNLPLKWKNKAFIFKAFRQFGEIVSAWIRTVPIDTQVTKKEAVDSNKISDSSEKTINAYILFKTEQSVEAALVCNLLMVGDNHIRADRICPPRKKWRGDYNNYVDDEIF